MPFKTPGEESEFLRGLYGQENDPVLKDLLAYADEHYIPVLLPESAAFLRTVVAAMRPVSALEIGTAVGYSTQVIARHGCEHLTTVEKDPARAEKAAEYLTAAGLSSRVDVVVADACEFLPALHGEFDFVFMDGPKTKYPILLPHITRLLKKGGVMLCDNVLWNGYIGAESTAPRKKETIVRGIREFLDSVLGSGEYVTSVIPVGDGMTLSVKK